MQVRDRGRRRVKRSALRDPYAAQLPADALLDLISTAPQVADTDSIVHYGNRTSTRDIDLWIEGAETNADWIRELIAANRIAASVDIGGPWSAREDHEWLAAARWNVAAGQLVTGRAVLAPAGMNQERCVAAYQSRCDAAGRDMLSRARSFAEIDPSFTVHCQVEGLRLLLRAQTTRSEQWRVVSRYTPKEVADAARCLALEQ